MPEVVAALAAYRQAGEDARILRWRARARVGRAVEAEYNDGKGSTLKSIAAKLEVADQQIFRYRDSYHEWLEKRPDDPLD